jgi:hypothetical protein
VLSTPPAFVLSQDQTLQQKLALTKKLSTTDGAVDNEEPYQNWHNTTSSKQTSSTHC